MKIAKKYIWLFQKKGGRILQIFINKTKINEKRKLLIFFKRSLKNENLTSNLNLMMSN